jgi:hypothetical protein
MYTDMRLAALRAVKIPMLILWVVTTCRLVHRYQRFEGTYKLHVQGETEALKQATKKLRADYGASARCHFLPD